MSVLFTRRGATPVTSIELSNYAVGDSVFLNVNGTPTEFLVVQQGIPDATLYDASCDGTWLLMKDIYTLMAVSESDGSVYPDTPIATYLMNDFFALLGEKEQAAIKEVTIPYYTGSGTSATGSCSATVFLLSCSEVGLDRGDYTYIPNNEGAMLSYFLDGTGTDAKALRTAYYAGTSKIWWTRSYRRSSTTSWLGIGTSGTYSTSTRTSEWGVRPALILPFTAKFDPETNVFLRA